MFGLLQRLGSGADGEGRLLDFLNVMPTGEDQRERTRWRIGIDSG